MSTPHADRPPEEAATTATATQPARGEPAASRPATRRLLPSMLFSALVLFATYGGLMGILLPSQVAVIDPAHKITNLAVVSTTSFFFTLFAQPIAGAISDRTRSRWGRRAPWMGIGAVVGGIFLFGISSVQDIFLLTVFWVVIQVALNFVQSPLTAITADRFPRSRRGVASAMLGIGMQVGMTLGVMVAGLLAANLGVAYAAFGAGVIVVTLAFVLLNRDWSTKHAAAPGFSWAAFAKSFWINPRRHPDFAWAFAARFAIILAFFVVNSYQLYLLTDYIGMSLPQGQGAVAMLALIALAPTLLSIALSGWWSDRVGRRKVFIYVASAVMVVGMAVPIFLPTLGGMMIMSVVAGFGMGVYSSVDAALMTEVLPSEGNDAGKDLGILNIASNIPQALSPAIAGVIITVLGYRELFVFAIVFVIVAAVAIKPVRGVK